MKHVRLIRHGESAANAGEPTRDHASIPLTAKGLEQAHKVARSFTSAPELIVASPFLRAQATALATTALYPTAAFEIWPIQEFTYLAPARCVGTTLDQRRGWVEAYWQRVDPAFSDGEGAQSFHDFVTRAQAFLDRLAGHEATDVVVFSHGQFMNAVAWLLECTPEVQGGPPMSDWRDFDIENHISNGCGFSLSRCAGDAAWTLRR